MHGKKKNLIHLINMPMARIDRPNLPLSLFKAILHRNGPDAVVHDMNILLAAQIGWDNYRYAEKRNQLSDIMNALWAPHAWGSAFRVKTDELLTLFKKQLTQKGDPGFLLPWLRKFRDAEISRFLGKAYETLLGYGPIGVVAFSCNATQTVPALALGRFIKERHPAACLVYGGPAFHDVMGDELIRKIEWIDAVSLGEADDVVVELFTNLSQGRDPAGLQGILFRDSHGEVRGGPAAKPIDLDFFCSLPDPDFSDFFNTAQRTGLREDARLKIQVTLPFEGSRGCWWGERSKCMFCGLNGCRTTYRARPGRQVLATILSQSEKYGCANLHAVDNVLCVGYFEDLIPALADLRKKRQLNLFCETKANLNRKMVAALADAGFLHLQPGIESLSSRHLRLMRKGTWQIQNIYFLKLCRQYGITPYWQHMKRIPGEQPDDYARLERLVPLITHLQPPHTGTIGEIELHRFSAYFDDKKWTRNIRPKSLYAYQFPADTIDLNRVAYIFEAQWPDTLGETSYEGLKANIEKWCRIWSRNQAMPCLWMKPSGFDGGLEIHDTRFDGISAVFRLPEEQAAIYKLLRDPFSFNMIMQRLQKVPGSSLGDDQVQTILDSFLERGLAIKDGKLYLGLALDADIPDRISAPVSKSSKQVPLNDLQEHKRWRRMTN